MEATKRKWNYGGSMPLLMALPSNLNSLAQPTRLFIFTEKLLQVKGAQSLPRSCTARGFTCDALNKLPNDDHTLFHLHLDALSNPVLFLAILLLLGDFCRTLSSSD